jgi:hypothetical protein
VNVFAKNGFYIFGEFNVDLRRFCAFSVIYPQKFRLPDEWWSENMALGASQHTVGWLAACMAGKLV